MRLWLDRDLDCRSLTAALAQEILCIRETRGPLNMIGCRLPVWGSGRHYGPPFTSRWYPVKKRSQPTAIGERTLESVSSVLIASTPCKVHDQGGRPIPRHLPRGRPWRAPSLPRARRVPGPPGRWATGRIRRQSRSPIGAPRADASSRLICVSLTSRAEGTDASS
jgi:hypothetical protein